MPWCALGGLGGVEPSNSLIRRPWGDRSGWWRERLADGTDCAEQAWQPMGNKEKDLPFLQLRDSEEPSPLSNKGNDMMNSGKAANIQVDGDIVVHTIQ